MTLRLRARAGPAFQVPERLPTFDASWYVGADARFRRVPLHFPADAVDARGPDILNGRVAAGETVQVGSTHVWEFVNQQNGMGMEMAHPIHLHGRQFRVLGRTGGRTTNALREGIVDDGWRDTVLVLPGETVRVQVTLPTTRGSISTTATSSNTKTWG